jgi:hypothetical protein
MSMKCSFQISCSCFLIAVLLFLATSCGWHHARQTPSTLSVPYVKGDSDGLLTAELIQQLEKQGTFSYAQNGGEYTLQVSLLDSKSENIGFRYDPKKLENGKRKTIPDETRRKLLAKVTVVNSASQKIILGPAYILGQADFDHEYYNLNSDTNKFSLGQLTDIDTTYDVVDIPLHRDLATQIAQYLENHQDLLKETKVQRVP